MGTRSLSDKRLLIVGAGLFQAPAIIKAKEMGITVITVDRNPQSIGFKYSDYNATVSTNDADGILRVAEKYKVDGIMTLSTEVAVVPVSYVSEKLRLPGIPLDVAQKATNKHLMRKAFKDNRVPSPTFRLIRDHSKLQDIDNVMKFPLMVKPTTGYASAGIQKVYDVHELYQACASAKKITADGSVLVEEFIDGIEVGGESFTVEGLTEMIYITNKKVTAPPRYVPLGHSLPSIFSDDIVQKIKDVIKNGVRALGVKNGPVNFDIMVTKNGPMVLEMGARLGGNCLPRIVEIHSGIDTMRESILLALGEKPTLLEKRQKPAGVRIITSPVSGVIMNIAGIDELKKYDDIVDIKILVNKGERVNTFKAGTDKIGYMIVTGNTIEEVNEKIDFYESKVRIDVSNQ